MISIKIVTVLIALSINSPDFYVTIDCQRNELPVIMHTHQWLGISIPPPNQFVVTGWKDTQKLFQWEQGTNFYLYKPIMAEEIKIYKEENYYGSVIVIPEVSSLQIMLTLIFLKGFRNGFLCPRKTT